MATVRHGKSEEESEVNEPGTLAIKPWDTGLSVLAGTKKDSRERTWVNDQSSAYNCEDRNKAASKAWWMVHCWEFSHWKRSFPYFHHASSGKLRQPLVPEVLIRRFQVRRAAK
jgi:hypothetical protein